jgi:hypothetical protein
MTGEASFVTMSLGNLKVQSKSETINLVDVRQDYFNVVSANYYYTIHLLLYDKREKKGKVAPVLNSLCTMP